MAFAKFVPDKHKERNINDIDMEKNDLKFVDAKREDVHAMLDLYNYYIVNSTATFDLEEISEDAFLQRIKIEDANYKTYIVSVNDIMIGFCFFIPYRKNPAYDGTVEIGLYIKPEFTGKRYGEKIVENLEAIIREKKFKNIIASISSDNTFSISLFKRLGYRQCADYRDIAYKHDHYVGIVDFQCALR